MSPNEKTIRPSKCKSAVNQCDRIARIYFLFHYGTKQLREFIYFIHVCTMVLKMDNVQNEMYTKNFLFVFKTTCLSKKLLSQITLELV